MARPFKFRYVNEIVGSFVLLIVVVLVTAIILAGKAQDWFVPTHHLQLAFPPEGSLGLQNNAEIQILGTTVGKIERIKVNDDGSMSAEFTIKGDFIRFVRDDSQAIAKKKFAVAGDSYVEITQGKGNPLPENAVIVCTKDTEITEMAQEILKQIKDSTVPAIDRVRNAVEEYTKLAADLRNPEGPLIMLLANLEKITQGLEKGEGSAGQLLRDPTIANEIEKILKDVNQSLDEVKKILNDVQNTSKQLPPMAEKVGGEINDLPGLMLQTQETIREAERLIEGIQKHWIIRKYINQPEPSSLIPPEEVSTEKGGSS